MTRDEYLSSNNHGSGCLGGLLKRTVVASKALVCCQLPSVEKGTNTNGAPDE